MSATQTDVHEFIEQLRHAVPPAVYDHVYRYFEPMHLAAEDGDMREVARLMDVAKHTMDSELKWERKKRRSMRR